MSFQLTHLGAAQNGEHERHRGRDEVGEQGSEQDEVTVGDETESRLRRPAVSIGLAEHELCQRLRHKTRTTGLVTDSNPVPADPTQLNSSLANFLSVTKF